MERGWNLLLRAKVTSGLLNLKVAPLTGLDDKHQRRIAYGESRAGGSSLCFSVVILLGAGIFRIMFGERTSSCFRYSTFSCRFTVDSFSGTALFV